MRIPWLIALLFLAACTSPQVDRQWWDREKGSFVADWPAPSLGVYADVQQRIEVVLAGSAADKAGVQVGDVLLDLRRVDGQTDAVSFADDAAIWALIRNEMELQKVTTWYSIRVDYQPVSGPFIVRLQRGNEILELEILLEGQPPWTTGAPTPTPVPRALRYF